MGNFNSRQWWAQRSGRASVYDQPRLPDMARLPHVNRSSLDYATLQLIGQDATFTYTPGIPPDPTRGIPSTDCVAMYLPIGAASYDDAQVNVVNPGTYDLTLPAFRSWPGWNDVDGFIGDGSNACLDTNLIPTDTSTIVIRFSNCPIEDRCVCGCDVNGAGSGGCRLYPHQFSTQAAHGWGNVVSAAASGQQQTAGVMAITKAGLYHNGTLVHAQPAYTWTGTAKTLYLLDVNGATKFSAAHLQAIAIYNVTKNATQIGDIATAMLAL